MSAEEAEKIDYVRSRAETAKILGISTRTLKRMEDRGQAPPRVNISTRIVGYRASAIEKFLTDRRAG
jgi:predicted DNA-binding transcriptional regulator AlpA